MICIAAILKHEAPFVEEWIAYHRLIGVDHFFLYDNDPLLPLRKQLAAHVAYVTVIEWLEQHLTLPGRNKQTKAYDNAVCRARESEWIAFIDVDEFIVLREDHNLPEFLARFPTAGAILLHWHYFGHNGHYEDPDGLIVEALTRRRKEPGRMTKSINRTSAICSISSAHHCNLRAPLLPVDANGRPYRPALYPGKTATAHVNHYACRSFKRWMNKAERGEAAFEPGRFPLEHRWRCHPEGCLRQFVQTVAKDMNEVVDDFLASYADRIRNYLSSFESAAR